MFFELLRKNAEKNFFLSKSDYGTLDPYGSRITFFRKNFFSSIFLKSRKNLFLDRLEELFKKPIFNNKNPLKNAFYLLYFDFFF